MKLQFDFLPFYVEYACTCGPKYIWFISIGALTELDNRLGGRTLPNENACQVANTIETNAELIIMGRIEIFVSTGSVEKEWITEWLFVQAQFVNLCSFLLLCSKTCWMGNQWMRLALLTLWDVLRVHYNVQKSGLTFAWVVPFGQGGNCCTASMIKSTRNWHQCIKD